MLVPVILSGGIGTRLWPMSRRLLPKQMLSLLKTGRDNHDLSLLQQTIKRAVQLPNILPAIVVCNQDYRFMVAEQLRRIAVTPGHIMLEPAGRNTAPAIALAAWQAIMDAGLWAQAIKGETGIDNHEPLLLVLPADHVIGDDKATAIAVEHALVAARQGCLVTFGVMPSRPETGYGYIEAGDQIYEGVYRVSRFEEKPTAKRAQYYIETGNYYWNSGMFLLPAIQYLNALKVYAPDIYNASRRAFEKRTMDLNFDVMDADAFLACPSDSIDYAVMERTKEAAVVPFSSSWNDIGAWNALYHIETPDKNGNVVYGDVVLRDVTNSYVRSNHRLVAGIGLQDMAIIETEDAVLVMPRRCAQEVKALVATLKEKHRPEVTHHQCVYRPWGYYETLSSGEGFLVKKITVYPHAKLSLQTHQHRSEHWVVVGGFASVVRGDETFTLSANASTYIPAGTRHRLMNDTDALLQVIEVQTGTYLAEDDIVRHEDEYARK